MRHYSNANQARWALVIDIYERAIGEAYPVVRHVFMGKTQDEARGYCEAHLKTDVFFRDCIEKGRWDGVDCWAVSEWIRI